MSAAALSDFRAGWLRGDLRACTAIAAKASPEALARCGAQALDECLRNRRISAEVAEVLRIARDSELWGDAHDAFSALRDRVLILEATPEEGVEAKLAVLYAAENLSRVLYNATGAPDPFDADSGAWMLHSLALLARINARSALSEQVWTIVERLLK